MKNNYVAPFLAVFFFFAAAGLPAAATTLLVWPDAPGGRLYRLRVPEGTLEEENAPGQWRTLGPVQLVGVDEREFPTLPYVRCVAPGRGSVRYLLVNCTQQVYRFDFARRTLTRLDRTFYRGYNCNNYPFVRRDTLYSFGGYGFWHTHGILSQYRPEKGEWEALSLTSEGPPAVANGTNAYLPERDAFFSALNYVQSESRRGGNPSVDPGVFRFSFRQRAWEKLGEVRSDLRERFPLALNREVQSFWTGRLFVFPLYEGSHFRFLLLDPDRNEARLWEDTDRRLAAMLPGTEPDPYLRRCWGDALVFHHFLTGTRGQTMRRVTLSASAMWRQGEALGAFYEPVGSGMALAWAGLAGVGVLALGGVWLVRRSRRPATEPVLAEVRPETDFQKLEPLPEKERLVLQALVAAYPTSLSGDALNVVLRSETKAAENQRRIRADAIRQINTKAQIAWRIPEAVVSTPTELDGRMFNYTLSAEAFERLRPKAGGVEA